jgi:hypothetical protein
MLSSSQLTKINLPYLVKQKIMDALPLVINQPQLKIMQDEIHQAISKLQDKSGQFDSADQAQQNLLTYGTQNYDEAHQLLQTLETQIKSKLAAWNHDPETAKPVEIPLNSYQAQLLYQAIAEKIENSDSKTAELLQDLLEQLPESSPQEHAD